MFYIAYYKKANGIGYKRIAFAADSIQYAWHLAMHMKHDDGENWTLVELK